MASAPRPCCWPSARRPTRCSRAARAVPADDLLRRADALSPRCSPIPTLPKTRGLAAARLHLARARRCRRTSASAGPSAFGVEILDGIGSTEMLHIFLSNRPGEVRYGTTGKPVPGYEVRLVDDDGHESRQPGEIGELQISGPTARDHVLEQPRARPSDTFHGAWTRSGDKYTQRRGRLLHLRRPHRRHAQGRRHLRLAVRGRGRAHAPTTPCSRPPWSASRTSDELVKPKAFVVLKPGRRPATLAEELQAHVKTQLAPYKYPRWIEFVRRAAEDRDRQDPALQAPGRGRTLRSPPTGVMLGAPTAQTGADDAEDFLGRTGLTISELAFGGGVTGGILIMPPRRSGTTRCSARSPLASTGSTPPPFTATARRRKRSAGICVR